MDEMDEIVVEPLPTIAVEQVPMLALLAAYPCVKEMTATALTVDFDDKEAWIDFGKELLTAGSAIQWYIGDWLRAGETYYDNPAVQGWGNVWVDGEIVSYAHAGEAVRSPETEIANLGLGYSRDTLLQFRRVSKVFPPSMRKSRLVWGHHQVVAAQEFKECRKEILDWADNGDGPVKSVQELRNYIKRLAERKVHATRHLVKAQTN